MNREDFIESLEKDGSLKNYFLNDLSSNLENSANHFRKLSFYIVLIPLIYISVGFSDTPSINFLGVELNTSLLVALFPVIYSYITLRAYTVWLLIKDMKELKSAFFEKEVGSKFQEYFFLLNPFSLTSTTSYKLPNSFLVFTVAIILFPFMVVTSLFPAFFQAYIIYNLYFTELSSDFLYYASLIIALMFSLQLLYTILKAMMYFLAEFRART